MIDGGTQPVRSVPINSPEAMRMMLRCANQIIEDQKVLLAEKDAEIARLREFERIATMGPRQ